MRAMHMQRRRSTGTSLHTYKVAYVIGFRHYSSWGTMRYVCLRAWHDVEIHASEAQDGTQHRTFMV